MLPSSLYYRDIHKITPAISAQYYQFFLERLEICQLAPIRSVRLHVCQQFGPIGAVTNCASPVLLDYGHGWDRNELIPPAECLPGSKVQPITVAKSLRGSYQAVVGLILLAGCCPREFSLRFIAKKL